MTDRELFERMLEALEEIADEVFSPYDNELGKVIIALRERLAQPKQEPVAWPCVIAEADFGQNTITLEMHCSNYKVGAGQHWLSTSPSPQRKPLTAHDIEVAAADGYQKGWDAAMFRNSLGEA